MVGGAAIVYNYFYNFTKLKHSLYESPGDLLEVSGTMNGNKTISLSWNIISVSVLYLLLLAQTPKQTF